MATRREFIKKGFGFVGVSFLMPAVVGRSPTTESVRDPRRRILVVVQLHGGNDGLNTLIPYANSRYLKGRPNLGFNESELNDVQGRSTLISDRFGFHPALSGIKELYEANKVAVVLGVGYPNPDLSHFTSIDVWHTASRDGSVRNGWLGRYADLALADKQFAAASFNVSSSDAGLPRTLVGERVIIPHIQSLDNYGFQTDSRYPDNRNNRLATFLAVNRGSFSEGSLAARVAGAGVRAVESVLLMNDRKDLYRSSVGYPADNPLAAGLKMVARMVTTMPEVNLLYVQLAGFDNHSRQIDSPKNKLSGDHAKLLTYFSEAVTAFYDDMNEQNLGSNVLLMEWSEFGRRVEENGSLGTDHGAASLMLVIGDPVRGGIYGEQPSLSPVDLDSAGNMRHNVDFRAVYTTILDRWLDADATAILGERFEDLGFLQ